MQLTATTVTITANTTNANVPDGVFIAPGGLTPGTSIGKHKVRDAAWHASSPGKLDADRDMGTRDAVRASLDVVTRALRLSAQ